MSGFVYAMMAGKFVKFGWASDVDARRLQLQTGCPWPIEVMAAVTWPRSYERAIHAMHEKSRSHGEWFELNDDTLRTVAQMTNNNPEEVAEFAGVRIKRCGPKSIKVTEAFLNELIHKFPVCAATKVCALMLKSANGSSVCTLTPYEVSDAIGVELEYARKLIKKVASSPFAERVGNDSYAIDKTAMFPGFGAIKIEHT